jgi:hypothetical protein
MSLFQSCQNYEMSDNLKAKKEIDKKIAVRPAARELTKTCTIRYGERLLPLAERPPFAKDAVSAIVIGTPTAVHGAEEACGA